MNQSTRVLILANLFGFIAVLVMNYLANALPLGGMDTGQLADLYPNLIVPAGLTFSIWGVIYSWLGVWIVFQTISFFSASVRARVQPGVEKAGWWFLLSCIANVSWLFAWHYRQTALSVLILTVLLYILIRLNQAAGVGRSASSSQEKWMSHAPYGLYQGWLTLALIANVTAFLVGQGWRGGGIPEAGWAAGMILVAAGLAVYIVLRTNNVFHGLAVSWACLGIFLKPYVGDTPNDPTVTWVALAACLTLLVTVIIRWRYWAQYNSGQAF